MNRFSNKVVLVTGGASGIGESAVRQFVQEGAKVLIADIDSVKGEQLALQLGKSARFVVCDHSNNDACQFAVETCIKTWGTLDVLFNNAAGTGKSSVENCTDEHLMFMLNSSLIGPWKMTKAAIAALKSAAIRDPSFGASIVFTGSRASAIAAPENSPYIVSKHAILGLTRSLAVDLGSSNIRVNAVCPGIVPTERVMQKTAWGTPEEVLARFLLRTPLNRITQAHEIANTVLFLASTHASAITGQAIFVDGGMSIH